MVDILAHQVEDWHMQDGHVHIFKCHMYFFMGL